jgi:hypothetical protein
MIYQHLVKCLSEHVTHVRLELMVTYVKEHIRSDAYLRHLNDIKQKCENMPFVLQVDSPCNKGTVVRRCPCISREMDLTGMFLDST